MYDPADTVYPDPPELGAMVTFIDDDGTELAGQVVGVRPARINETHAGRQFPHCHPPSVDVRVSSRRTELCVVAEGTPHAKTRRPVTRRCYRVHASDVVTSADPA